MPRVLSLSLSIHPSTYLSIDSAKCSLSFLDLFWCLSSILKNFQPLILHIFLIPISPVFSFWYFNYVYSSSFNIVARFFHFPFISLCLSEPILAIMPIQAPFAANENNHIFCTCHQPNFY